MFAVIAVLLFGIFAATLLIPQVFGPRACSGNLLGSSRMRSFFGLSDAAEEKETRLLGFGASYSDNTTDSTVRRSILL